MGPPKSTNHGSFLCLCLAASTQEPGELDKKSPRPGAWAFKEQGFRSLQSANLKTKQRAIIFWKLPVSRELWAPEKVEVGEKKESEGEDPRGMEEEAHLGTLHARLPVTQRNENQQ